VFWGYSDGKYNQAKDSGDAKDSSRGVEQRMRDWKVVVEIEAGRIRISEEADIVKEDARFC